MKRSWLKHNTAFLLVEVLIAVVILSLGMVAIQGAFHAAGSISKRVRDYFYATRALEKIIVDLSHRESVRAPLEQSGQVGWQKPFFVYTTQQSDIDITKDLYPQSSTRPLVPPQKINLITIAISKNARTLMSAPLITIRDADETTTAY